MCSCISNLPLLCYSNMTVRSGGQVDLKPSFTNIHLMCKRTKHLFHIPKFIPNRNHLYNSFNQYSRRNRVSSLYESLKTLRSIQLFPVVHAKLLTPEQIEELQRQKKQIKVTESEVRDYLANETGWDRLRQMFSKDHKGEGSADLAFVWGTSFRSGLMCYLAFYIMKFRELKKDFVRENKGTTYYSVFMAGRKIRDKTNTGAMKHGARWGFRVFTIVGITLLITQTIAVYRNKSSIWECIIGTAVAGSLSRFSMGPKGMFSGLVFGAIFGIPISFTVMLFLKANNVTQEERHYFDVIDRISYVKELRGEKGEPETV